MMSPEVSAAVAAAAIAAIASVAVAVINAVAMRRQKEAQAASVAYHERQELLEAARAERELAVVDGVCASLGALDVTLIALHGGHLNGNVDAARMQVERAYSRINEIRNEALVKL